ncbi:MAG: Ig-like domain-containing protein, partial [Actinomycetota bacterium]|nr:Ig-like domain-containing protein [Actinomycetota bacterium]
MELSLLPVQRGFDIKYGLRATGATSGGLPRFVATFIGPALLAGVALVLTVGPSATSAGSVDETCGSHPATIVGTPRDDLLVGSPRRDVIVARGGHDVIKARAGNDLLCGKNGADKIKAGPGDDVVRGSRRADEIHGGRGSDLLDGRKGKDKLHGDAGADELMGGLGIDRADGGAGLDDCDAETEISCNSKPRANADSFDVDEDDVLDVPAPGVLGDDTDADGDPLKAKVASPPSHGVVNLNPNGSLTYSPDADFAGSDSFTYRARDAKSSSARAAVEIDVAPVNDPPTDITLGDNTIDENEAIGTAVGTFSVDDPDASDTNTLSLVSGT